MTQELKILIGIGIATLLVIVGAVFFLSNQSPTSEVSPETVAQNQEFLVRENSNRIGSESASVTLVEFADFQCPACKSTHPVIKRLLSEYQEDVQFVFRHFPLPGHKNAKVAAYAAEAAGRQGKFWEMHDMLFANQGEWAESNSPVDLFTTYASELELDTDQFAEDIEDDELISKVNDDQRDGSILGVSATPTIFVNGKPAISSYSELKQAIDTQLQAS